MKKRYFGIAGLALASTLLFTACSGGSGTALKKVEGKSVEKTTKNVYVAPNGTGNGSSESSPMDFMSAVGQAKPGDTLLLAGGSYCYDSRLQVNPSGEEYNYITVKPKSDSDRVIFDFSSQDFNGSNRGIQVYGDYWNFYGLEIMGAGDNGMYIAGSHNIIDNCLFYNNRDTGLQLGRGFSSQTTLDEWPSYNIIRNCTSFANYDAETLGENADGFAAKLTIGYGNIFDGCVAFRNSDDGWDLFAKVDSGDIGTVVLYNCASFENGFLPYQIDKTGSSSEKTYNTLNGDGIGFKLGGSTMQGNVIVKNCSAWDNKLHGVGDNSNPGVISVNGFTSFNNCAGFNENGTVRSIRGIDGDTNKSNNIDLARNNNSYNNYYGILSYVNNQSNGFSTKDDSSYNADKYKGSTAYSIFQVEYKVGTGEVYDVFEDYEDASIYQSEIMDQMFSTGTREEMYVSDSDFKNLTSLNMKCDNVNSMDQLISRVRSFRNTDNSVNFGDHLALSDSSSLKTFADGKPVGAILNKTSMAEYEHYGLFDFENNDLEYTDDETAILSALSCTEVIGNKDAIYQDFKLPKYMQGADLKWESDNTDVISIEQEEVSTISASYFSWARVRVPSEDVKVKLTCTATRNSYYDTKEIEITVKGRRQTLGQLVSSNGKAIRVDLNGFYTAPYIYASDGSAITLGELPEDLYEIKYTYEYAVDGNSKFYKVDNVYTSVAGVYRVTAKATWKADESITSSFTFNVYVVDPDCSIDFMTQKVDGKDVKSIVGLSYDGFVVNGKLSNIDGYVVAITSETELNISKAADIIAKSDYQKYQISDEYVSATFKADNSKGTYYIYYAVVNRNMSNAAVNDIYTAEVSVQEISTTDQFYALARGTTSSANSKSATTIYSLKNDLDFTGYNWNVSADGKAFSGLFRGNGHTISNLTINAGTIDKGVNIFFKVKNGTVMDVNFDNIHINGNREKSKQIGIIGDLQGGFVYNVHATRFAATGYESVGAIVGKVTGDINYVALCSLVNPVLDMNTKVSDAADAAYKYYEVKATSSGIQAEFKLDTYNTDNQYIISAKNKYFGGIIGNAQKDSDPTSFELKIENCYVNAVVGDGQDSSGNGGLILGRVKNDFEYYKTEINTCAVYGMLIAKGQYTSGIVGDFDNGVGYVSINNNFSNVQFVYNSVYLNAMLQQIISEEAQNYAHKNSNPIVGRAVKAETGIYECKGNIGSFVEYYSTYIESTSIYFNYSNYVETGDFVVMTEDFLKTALIGFDFEKIWTVKTGSTASDDAIVVLKVLNK